MKGAVSSPSSKLATITGAHHCCRRNPHCCCSMYTGRSSLSSLLSPLTSSGCVSDGQRRSSELGGKGNHCPAHDFRLPCLGELKVSFPEEEKLSFHATGKMRLRLENGQKALKLPWARDCDAGPINDEYSSCPCGLGICIILTATSG
nr:DNA-binding protein HEXBP-like [Ipomoea batatas]